MKIETLRCGDNFIYVLLEGSSAAVVDPGAARGVLDLLEEQKLRLDLVLVTHLHGDHTGGCEDLRRLSRCRIIGPPDLGRGMIDRAVGDGECLDFAGNSIEVLAVPGHTDRCRAYYQPTARAVFTGDTLFACGCGRVRGGMARMWRSLCRLRELPDETVVFGGHDYTLDNLEFAADLEPDNADVRDRLRHFRENDAAGRRQEASTVREEKLTNPFLRCDDPIFMRSVGMSGRRPAEVFAAIRGRKDRW